MTREIQKFTIAVDKDGMDPIIQIPEGSHFLTLNYQEYNGVFMANHPDSVIFDMWWDLDVENANVDVQLYIRPTMGEVPVSSTYLGSFFPHLREFHVFQKDLIFQDMHIVDGKFVPRSQ